MPKASIFEHAFEFDVAASALAHLELTIRVDDLVAKSADREIRTLREEHDTVGA
jgi:hypothetical protein